MMCGFRKKRTICRKISIWYRISRGTGYVYLAPRTKTGSKLKSKDSKLNMTHGWKKNKNAAMNNIVNIHIQMYDKNVGCLSKVLHWLY